MLLFCFGVLLTALFELINEPLTHPPHSITLPMINWVTVYGLWSATTNVFPPTDVCFTPKTIIVLLVHAIGSMVWFTMLHRLFHTRRLYTLHKVHHTYKHLSPRAALYAHPVEAIVVNAGSVCAPTAILADWLCPLARHAVLVVAIIQAVTAHTDTRAVQNYYHQKHHKLTHTNFGFSVMSNFDRI